MRRRLADRIVPADALSGFAHVAWRKVDPLSARVSRGEVLVASGGLCAPVIGMFGPTWHEAHGWRRWPSLSDMLPVVRAPRGAVVYASLPPQHGRPTLGADDFRGWPYPRSRRHARR